MVIPDLSAPVHDSSSSVKPASTMDRFLGGIFDIILLVPIATFVPSLHIREARMDYLQGFESNIWYQVVFLWILTYIVVQTVFLYYARTTPGGMIVHTRVRSLNGNLTWNQCLIRASFSLLSWVFLCFPFLEIITHPMKRAWHDRVSDTVVVDLKSKPFYQIPRLNVSGIRVFMILGIFAVLLSVSTFVGGQDELSYLGDESSSETTDSLVAQALLKKDFSEETQGEIEERIWGGGRKWEKALAYFFKLHVEKDTDVKKALVDQICKWSPSEKAGGLCSISKYSLKNDHKTLMVLAQHLDDIQGLTSKVFVLKELTKNSQYSGALKLYKRIKKQASLSDSFKDSLKIWDVSLFWALRENQMKGKRVPASEPTSEEEASAIRAFEKERGLP